MATSVDERIVQAKFDASDFEKGVNKTIKKLDELKKSLNLDSAKKSVAELAEKTEASTNSMKGSLDKLTDRLTTFSGMVKQKILGGLADEVAGVFMKIENSVKNLITGISTQQVSAGLEKYQQILTSVRVMVSAGKSESASYEAIDKLQEYSDQTSYSLTQMTDAMSKMVAAGVDLDVAAKSVEGIANACANAGVNATDAQRAFYNLSQAYSKGTLNYTDYKSLELLNMTTAQFKEEMLEAAVAAGTLTKSYKTVVKEGEKTKVAVYKTSNKTDKKVKGGKTVTLDNMSDMLKYDFMNKAAMNKLFGEKFYFDEGMLDDIYKELGTSKFKATEEERAKALKIAEERYGKVAVAAYNAAKEARSFTDVLNTFKDAVSTGWAKTFEHLFGKLETAKDFFTELTEGKLAEAIYKIGEWRNALLDIWNSDLLDGEDVGGKMFRDSILRIVEALGTLFGTIQQVLPGMTELQDGEEDGGKSLKELGRQLKYVTREFRDFVTGLKNWAEKFNKWMNEAIDENGMTRIDRIRNILSNIGSVFGIVGKVGKIALSGIAKVLTALAPLFDGIAVALEKITNPLSELKNNDEIFNDIEDTIENLSKVLEPIAKVLGEVIGFLGEIGAFIVNMAIGTVTSNIEFLADAIGALFELFTGSSAQKTRDMATDVDEKYAGVIGRIRLDIEALRKTCAEAIGAISEFFTALFADLRKLLGIEEKVEGENQGAGNQNGGLFANLKNFFDTNQFLKDAQAWVDQAVVDIENFFKTLPDRIGNLATRIQEFFNNLFYREETFVDVDENGKKTKFTQTVKTELLQWIEQTAADIWNWILDIPNKIHLAAASIYDVIRSWFFKDETYWDVDENGRKKKITTTVTTGLGKWVEQAAIDIGDWIADLPNKIVGWIGEGFDLLNTFWDYLFGKRVDNDPHHHTFQKDENGQLVEVQGTIVSRFDEFVSSIISSIGNWFNDLPKNIESGLKGVGDFASKVWGKISEFLFGKKKVTFDVDEKGKKTKYTTTVKTGFSRWLDGIIKEAKKFIASIPELIGKGIGKGVDFIGSVINALFGVGDGSSEDAASKQVDDKLKKPFLNIDLTSIWNTIKGIGKKIVNGIGSIFTGSDDVEINSQWFADGVANGIEWIKKKAVSAFETVRDWFVNLPGTIANFFKGEGKDATDQNKGPIGQAITDFASSVGSFIESIPTAIAEFFTNAITEIGKLWDGLYKGIIGEADGTAKEAAEESSKKTTEWAENEFGYPASYKHNRQKSKWEEFVESFGKMISTAFENLPVWIAQGIEIAVTKMNELLGSLGDWINSINAEELAKEAEEAAKEASEKIQEGAEKGTEGTTQDVTDAATKAVDQAKEESPFIKSIKNIGLMLYNAITTTIPNLLTAAWEWVVRKGGEVWKVLSGLFDKYVPDDFKKTINNIGTTISTAISGIADFIKNAFQSIFIKKDPFEMPKNVPLGMQGTLKGILDAQKKSVENVGKGEQKSIFQTISDWFGELFSENGLLGGDIGQKISNFFLKTVPEFIGKAIGNLINAIPQFISNLNNGIISTAKGESEEADKEAEEVTETVMDIGSIFAGLLSSLTKQLENGTLAEDALSIVQLIAIIEMVKAIGQLFSAFNVTKNLAEKAEANNGFFAAIKRIATAIMVTFALVTYISTLPDEKRESAERVLTNLIDLFKIISTWTGIGSVVKSGVEGITGTLDTIADMRDPWRRINKTLGEVEKTTKTGKLEKIGDGVATSMSTILTAAGATAAGEMVQYGIQDIIGSVVQVFEALSSGLQTVSTYISQTVATLMEIKDNIDSALEIAGKAVELIKTLSGISEFKDEIEDIQTYMPQLSGALELFKNAVSGRWIKADELVDSIDRLIKMRYRMKAFAEFTKSTEFEDFKYGIASIGSALSLYSTNGIGEVGSDAGISAAVKALRDILGNDEFTGLAAELDTSKYPDARDMYSASEKLVILAGAVASIGKAAAGIGDDAGENIKKLFQSVSEIELPKKDEDSISNLALQFATIGNALSTFANDTTTLTEDKLKTAKIAIDLMVDLMTRLKGTGQSFIEKVFEGDEGLGEFGAKLSVFGTKLNQFFTAIDKDAGTWNTDNISTALIAIRTIAVAYRDLNEKELVFKTGWEHLGNGLDTFGTTLKTFIDNIKVISIDDAQLEKVKNMLSFVRTLAEIAKIGFGNDANLELGEMAQQLNPEYNDNNIGNAMVKFFESVGKMKVDEEGLETLKVFGETLKALAEIAGLGLSTRVGGIAAGKTLFTSIAESFGAFNTQFDDMKEFFVNVKEFDKDGIAIAVDLFKSLRDFGEALSFFSEINVDRGLNNLKWFDWVSLADTLQTKMYSAFEEHKDSYKSVGTLIAQNLYAGIQEAIDDPKNGFQPEITPVLKMGEFNKGVKDAFGLGEDMQFDLGTALKNAMGLTISDSFPKPIDYSETLDRLEKAVSGLDGRMEKLGTDMENLQVIMDTGVLVGQVSPGVYRNIKMYNHLGVDLGVTVP